MERLQKIIASSGYCSRRHAEDLIKNGRVSVNGQIVTELGSKAEISDEIRIDGKKIYLEEKVYYLLNKPSGYITTNSDTHGRKKVIDLFGDVKERIFPVGRLDYDTTGLLILTNDGDLALSLIHPRYEVTKTYIAIVKPSLPNKIIDMLTTGVYLEDGFVKASNVKILSHDKLTCTLEISISVGRKHIVKRMVKYIGGEVIQLHRYSIDFLTLGDLKSGQYRKLTSEEVERLKNL